MSLAHRKESGPRQVLSATLPLILWFEHSSAEWLKNEFWVETGFIHSFINAGKLMTSQSFLCNMERIKNNCAGYSGYPQIYSPSFSTLLCAQEAVNF